MEGFLIVVGIYIAYHVINRYFTRKDIDKFYANLALERLSNAFKCKIENDTFGDKEDSFEVFHLKMKGLINGPYDNFSVKFVVKILDITSSELPVLSSFEKFQSRNSTAFFYESELDTLPYKNTIFNDWVTTIRIPKIFLIFPRRGNRKLRFDVYATTADNKIYEEAQAEIEFYNNNVGYEEASENRQYFEEMVIKTAMLVGASDGHIGQDEAKIIKEWARKRVDSYIDQQYKEEVKLRLNKYIKEAYEEIENNSIDIYEILEGIQNVTTEGENFELFEVCLDVAKADGKADEKELKIIHDIAKYINLDEKMYRKMVEKSLPITMHTSNGSDVDILGITPNMDNDEINKHLRDEYKKWNARVASKDPGIREQAEKMIQLIAEARKKYK